jgi:15-cis-phytoene synthase
VNPQSILHAHGRSFWWAGWLLPATARDACARLYAVCRTLDDWVDRSPPELARSALDATTAALATARLPDALSGWMSASEVRAHAPNLVELCTGLRHDLDGPNTLADEAALLEYASLVAGSVGEMMARTLGVNDPDAIQPARDLGVAMQLTNIARDVFEDANAKRIYLPATWLGRLDLQALASGDKAVAAELAPVLARLLALADSYYLRGRAGLHFLPRRARLGIGVAARLYQAIGGRVLQALEQQRYHQRVVVGPGQKLVLIARELLP